MIIEGKHAEIGQGIFISDIQEGSSAEKVTAYLLLICLSDLCCVFYKAGLEIGEMILAVNKDTLLGSSYSTVSASRFFLRFSIYTLILL